MGLRKHSSLLQAQIFRRAEFKLRTKISDVVRVFQTTFDPFIIQKFDD